MQRRRRHSQSSLSGDERRDRRRLRLGRTRGGSLPCHPEWSAGAFDAWRDRSPTVAETNQRDITRRVRQQFVSVGWLTVGVLSLLCTCVCMYVCVCARVFFVLPFQWQHDDSRPPWDNGLKCVMGVSLKSTLLESDHVSRRRRPLQEKPSAPPHVRLHGVMSPAGGTQVLLSGASANCLPPHFAQIHYLGNGERGGEITDQRRTNSLTSSSCLSTFRTSCVFSSERERGRGRGGLKTREHIDQPTEEQHFMTTDPTPPQQRKRERGVGGGGGGAEERIEAGRKQHTRTHLKIYLHILCTRGANIWCLVVIGVYKAFVGFCCFFCLVLPLPFFSVEERWDTSCQLKGKGGVSFAHLPEVWSPTQND